MSRHDARRQASRGRPHSHRAPPDAPRCFLPAPSPLDPPWRGFVFGYGNETEVRNYQNLALDVEAMSSCSQADQLLFCPEGFRIITCFEFELVRSLLTDRAHSGFPAPRRGGTRAVRSRDSTGPAHADCPEDCDEHGPSSYKTIRPRRDRGLCLSSPDRGRDPRCGGESRSRDVRGRSRRGSCRFRMHHVPARDRGDSRGDSPGDPGTGGTRGRPLGGRRARRGADEPLITPSFANGHEKRCSHIRYS